MKRQLPKNIRQIGNVSDTSKIYVEDYVDTFFNQLCDKAEQFPIGAFLIGEIVEEAEEEYIYIYGAIRMSEVGKRGKDIYIEDNVWKQGCEECKEYFGDAEILGWFLIMPGQALGVTHNIMKIHQRLFGKDFSIFVMKDAMEKEEQFYIHKYRELMESSGHYIYYEKNEEMQNYMIASRKEVGITPSEVVEDRITKDFRHVVREKMQTDAKKQNRGVRYVMGGFAAVFLLGVVVTVFGNYDRMNQVKETFGNFVAQIQKEEEVSTKLPIQGIEQKEPSNSQGEQKEPSALQGEGKDAEVVDQETKQPEGEKKEDSQEDENVEKVDQKVENKSYIVEKGDTLATISAKVYGDMSHVDEICQVNGLQDGNLIFIGQKLLLP